MNKKILQVKIVKCERPGSWYKDHINSIWVVYGGLGSTDFIVKEDYDKGSSAPWRHIEMEDVEILKTEKMPERTLL